MRVAFYTHPAFFESALHLSRELGKRLELHVVLEVTPWTWQQAGFDIAPLDLSSGMVPAAPLLDRCLPGGTRSFLESVASVHFVVHHGRRSLSPKAWLVSQRALAFLRALEPDVLHIDDPDESLRLAIAAPWRLAAPLVLSVHDPTEHSGEHAWRNGLARLLLFRRASQFVLHNRAMLPGFCQRYRLSRRRVRSIPLGALQLAMPEPCAAPRDAGPVVLFFGRLSPYKGLEVLFAAAPEVAARVPGVRFVVAGRPIRGYRLPAVPPLPGAGSVELNTEYIHNAQLQHLFTSARVVVCPYVDATQSGVVLTAYGYGKPVVATRVGGLPDYVIDGESGLLVCPSDPHALASALIRILEDAALRDHLQTGIERLAAGPLGWSSIAEQTVDLYHNALHQR